MKCAHKDCKQDPCYDDAAWHMQIAEHTQTPWHIELGLKEYSIWGGKTSREIDRVATLCGDKDFDPIAQANAAFIVQCVNSHLELLASVKEYLHDLERGKLPTGEYWAERVELITKAIAKAEGRE